LICPIGSGIMMLMRTTLTLDDDVLKAARRVAREQDRPLKDVINDALRQGLALGEARRRPAYRFRMKTVGGRLLPGVDLADRDKLYEVMERG
jgi:predicted transcriptional regulator